ncbi:neuronal acetylcholine receptor subunit non-alpha-2-like [Saccostrea cucullata]|uniref:neuronal acetylcholine receptor subunit non-alpha-2-like n=1 Tax=Saccostrea cuccullata TaxID=36930 RepID=UPI002ED40642
MAGKHRRARDILHILLLFYSLIHLSRAYTMDDEVRLHKAFNGSGYDRNVRPKPNRNTPLKIDCNFILQDIRELDENLGKFSITGALAASWIDERLIWKPQDYGGVTYTVIPQKMLWIPYFINMHVYSEPKYHGHEELTVLVWYNGNVNWTIPNLYESTCDFDLTKYPFDSQTCMLTFFAMGSSPNDLFFNPLKKTADMSIYRENGLWQVTDTHMNTSTNILDFHELRLTVSMKRRSAYYISSLILPICVLEILQVLVFVMPHDSGERVGFAVTVMLAIAVYLTLIQEKLPEAAEPSVASLSYKLLGDFVIGAFIVVGVIIGSHFNKEEKENKNEKENENEKETEIPSSWKLFHRIMLSPTSRRNQKMGDALTWSDIGMAIDRFCLILSFLSLVLCNSVYFIVVVIL